VGSQLSFYLFAPHPDGRVRVHNLHDWLLRKGACGARGTLKQGEQENSFGQYSSLSNIKDLIFEMRTSGDKQLFV
jgi:hypothetical protein